MNPGLLPSDILRADWTYSSIPISKAGRLKMFLYDGAVGGMRRWSWLELIFQHVESASRDDKNISIRT